MAKITSDSKMVEQNNGPNNALDVITGFFLQVLDVLCSLNDVVGGCNFGASKLRLKQYINIFISRVPVMMS